MVIDFRLVYAILVPKKGLEPPHPCEYVDLNHARLPIPPLRHKTQIRRFLPVRQHLQVSQTPPAVSNRTLFQYKMSLKGGIDSNTR